MVLPDSDLADVEVDYVVGLCESVTHLPLLFRYVPYLEFEQLWIRLLQILFFAEEPVPGGAPHPNLPVIIDCGAVRGITRHLNRIHLSVLFLSDPRFSSC